MVIQVNYIGFFYFFFTKGDYCHMKIMLFLHMVPYLLSRWEYFGVVFNKQVPRTNGISRQKIKKDLELLNVPYNIFSKMLI